MADETDIGMAHDATMPINNGLDGTNKDVICDMTSGDSTSVVVTHYTARSVVASDAGVSEGKVVDVGISSYSPEEALV